MPRARFGLALCAACALWGGLAVLSAPLDSPSGAGVLALAFGVVLAPLFAAR